MNERDPTSLPRAVRSVRGEGGGYFVWGGSPHVFPELSGVSALLGAGSVLNGEIAPDSCQVCYRLGVFWMEREPSSLSRAVRAVSDWGVF